MPRKPPPTARELFRDASNEDREILLAIWRDAMAATKTCGSSTLCPECKRKHECDNPIPDHRTRMAAAKDYLAEGHGKPEQKTQVVGGPQIIVWRDPAGPTLAPAPGGEILEIAPGEVTEEPDPELPEAA